MGKGRTHTRNLDYTGLVSRLLVPFAYIHELVIKINDGKIDLLVRCDVFEIIVFGVRLFPVHPSPNINCSLEKLTYPVTMATTSCTLHTTMQPWIFCHGIFTKVSTTIIIKMNHNQVSIGLLYSTFPLTVVLVLHVL